MWDESLIESRGVAQTGKRWIGFPLAILFQASLIGILIFCSYWFIEAVEISLPGGIPEFAVERVPAVLPVQLGVRIKAPEVKEHVEKQETPITQQNMIPEDSSGQRFEPEIPEVGNSSASGSLPIGDPLGVKGGVPPDSGGGSGSGFGNGGEPPPEPIRPEMEQPILLVRVQPEYPRAMIMARVEGVVILEAVISRIGDVENVRILQSLNPMLDASAIRAVQRWKYRPATLNGRPLRVYFTVTVHYKIR